MKVCATLGIKQIFTSWNNPKGNADTERVMRTIKEDLVWPREWDFPFELERALKQTIFPNEAPDSFGAEYLKSITI